MGAGPAGGARFAAAWVAMTRAGSIYVRIVTTGAISQILVVGGGWPGLFAAVNLKTKLPHIRVQVLRQPLDNNFEPDGLASDTEFATYLHHDLGVPQVEFVKQARATWRIGTRYHWGPRPFFDHTSEFQIDTRYAGLSRETGYYLSDDATFEAVGPASARMSANRIFFREQNGSPQMVQGRFAYHFEPARMQKFLLDAAQRMQITFRDGLIAQVLHDEMGIKGLRLEDGQTLTADLYIDNTGLRSQLLGETLCVPWTNYSPSLACDSAIVASWPRGNEPIRPHTTVQAMDAGWSWRTEHEQLIACGYAFSSAHLQADEAERALKTIYPNCTSARRIKFRQGHHERCWEENVVAIGNAGGFVEPLAAAGPGLAAFQCQSLAQTLVDCDQVPRPSLPKQFNKRWRRLLQVDRDFLGLFYKYNTRLDTPFWRDAQANAHLGSLEEVLRCYQDIGPNSVHRYLLLTENDPIGLEGYFSVLTGQKVPHRPWTPPQSEAAAWQTIQDSWRRKAATGFTIEELLRQVQSAAPQPAMMTGAAR
jgi:tryptophan 7-halogenase